MRKQIAVLTLMSAAWIACAVPARAGLDRFTSVSPKGALVSALIIDPSSPSTIYAGARAGVFKSINAGESWSLVLDSTTVTKDSIVERIIVPVAIDPIRPSTVYAGTHTGEVFKTIDGGASWTLLPGIKEPNAITTLVVDPVNSETLYALTSSELLQSVDGGRTWISRAAGLTSEPREALFALAIDPSQPSRLYAGSARGLFVTQDRGQKWTLLRHSSARRIVVDPDNSMTIYTADRDRLSSTRDGGLTWMNRQVGPSFETRVSNIVIDRSSSAAYALVAPSAYPFIRSPGETLVTMDRGLTWKLLPPSLPDATVLAITPAPDSTFYAASRGDVFKSDDRGENWRRIHEGLNSAAVSDIEADPKDSSSLLAATPQGIVKSTDAGQSWSDVKLEYTNAQLALDRRQPSTVFALNSEFAARSVDAGQSWMRINPGNEVRAIAVDPSDSAKVYATLADGLARSTDGGSTWTPAVVQLPFIDFYGFEGAAIAVDPVTPANVYAAGSAGIVKSTDGGATWRTVFTPDPRVFNFGIDFRKLLIDPGQPATIYALSSSTVHRSENGGKDWSVAYSSSFQQGFNDLELDPLRPWRLYLATTDGLLRSVYRGEEWRDFSKGLPTRSVSTVTVDTSGNVYAGTPRGLFVLNPNRDPVPGASTLSVSLQTAAGNYVSAQHCGGSFVNANAQQAGPCETFALYDLNARELKDGDTIYLRAADDNFVVAEGGGGTVEGSPATVNANRQIPRSWETFTIRRLGGAGPIRAGDAITLQSINGSYLAADGGGSNGCQCDSRLTADRAEAREWETFVLVVH